MYPLTKMKKKNPTQNRPNPCDNQRFSLMKRSFEVGVSTGAVVRKVPNRLFPGSVDK